MSIWNPTNNQERFELNICESENIGFKPERLYYFSVDPDCEKCIEMAMKNTQPDERNLPMDAEHWAELYRLRADTADNDGKPWYQHAVEQRLEVNKLREQLKKTLAAIKAIAP